MMLLFQKPLPRRSPLVLPDPEMNQTLRTTQVHDNQLLGL